MRSALAAAVAAVREEEAVEGRFWDRWPTGFLPPHQGATE